MGSFPSIDEYFREIDNLFEYGEYSSFAKRLIDLTLDTQDVRFYRRMPELLDWYDLNTENISSKKDILLDYYNELQNTLRKQSVKERDKLIEVNNLTKKYRNSSFTLGPLNLTISAGEIIGLVGENGNGKTTLLRLLCRELVPTEGDINYCFKYKNEYDLRTKLVYIPQRTKDWHGSLLSNLYFTASSYGITGEENELLVELIVARMGLRRFRNHNWKDLSSGYKMRFELARMLLRKPELLLVDEPLANLDILAQQVILDDFKNITKSPFRPLGIILSSQQLYEVEKTSDYVIFLKNGKPNKENISSETEEDQSNRKLIIEFESDWKHEQLVGIFSQLNLEKLHLEAGTFIAIFPMEVSSFQFMEAVVNNQVPVIYFRNISNSTRRFFLS